MTSEHCLRLHSPTDLIGVGTFLSRLIRLEPGAVVRLRGHEAHVVLWTAPIGVLARRDIGATMAGIDRTMRAAELLTAMTEAAPGAAIELPPDRPEGWHHSLPGEPVWTALDDVPIKVLVRLADAVASAVRGAADPPAAGAVVLDQTVLTLSAGPAHADVPGRIVVALARLGLLIEPVALVRFSVSQGWIQAAAEPGAVFLRRPHTGLRLL